MLRKLALVTVILGFLGNASAQRRVEGGPFLGVAYYNGDLNPQRQFYNVHPAFGGLLRMVFNDRLAAKGTLTLSDLSGSYPREDLLYPVAPNREGYYSFRRTIGDVSAQIEFNFFSFDHIFKSKQTTFTPYLSTGIATTLYRKYKLEDDGTSSHKPHFILSLPVGIGVKWKPVDWMRVGAEWSFRKTFADDLDRVKGGAIDPADPYGFDESSLVHNNDWYSFAGVYATFTLFKQRTPCNAGY